MNRRTQTFCLYAASDQGYRQIEDLIKAGIGVIKKQSGAKVRHIPFRLAGCLKNIGEIKAA